MAEMIVRLYFFYSFITPPPQEAVGAVTTQSSDPPEPGKKRRAIMAKGVQKTLSKTSLLGNFLPTGTLITFEMTVFMSVFKPGLAVSVPKDDKYKVGFQDFVHAVMSVMVFVAIAFSDYRVTNCLFPGHEREMDQIMESFPMMIGIVCSGLFLIFPTSRHGIGCMSA
ncbi:hypothetical protein KIW84_032699 [Lathyrus oleraceus]|uniref:Uncharacterized protein n=1 Tax=Pisum sativum TaxID=3888 RepID=A0A9D4XTT4_PEA|nr:hypothetical protein KIW84_032699 [Pisum sativum]